MKTLMNRIAALVVVVVLIFRLTGNAHATTVVAIVVRDGIVVGADGKTTNAVNGPGKATKAFLLKKRLIVANLGIENDPGFYNFSLWIKSVDCNTAANISLSALVETIRKHMRKNFAHVIGDVESGALTKELAVKIQMPRYLVEYVVAGYEEGAPKVYTLSLVPDWNKKVVNGPILETKIPVPGRTLSTGVFCDGIFERIEAIRRGDRHAQEEFLSRFPAGSIRLNSDDWNLGEASMSARAFLGIEAKHAPDHVGFPVTIITLRNGSHGSVNTYTSDVAHFTDNKK